MRVLVIGRDGQVARSLADRAAAHAGIEVKLAGRPQLDLLEPGTVRASILAARPDVVVSAAAYTAVDQAEDEPDVAFAVNAAGARAVAQAAAEVDAAIIHLSTDYVFSGDAPGEYAESDATDPRNVYGLSKLEGEKAVAAANPRHVILRTAWVYSPYGRNFVKTMLALAKERDRVRVVADQWGNPTSAADIAEGVLRIAQTVAADRQASRHGIFNLAGQGATSWAGFARHVFATSARLGGPSAQVEEIATADYPTKARRPLNSRLSCQKLLDVYGWRPPAWRESCWSAVARLVGGN
ncbi:dTDP-4-dehydrorhamnose reductase [Mesorhizobium sp. KR9-304]|uniref:dTDP-4-dehydrorhamnose reductase n=1 Tax=Mesorhizobium sp. KR9-304 TaxID=3156614 RepID=UPI0032B35BE6